VSQLTAEQWERYARQIGPGVLSRDGQERLSQATVFISRIGGMGGPAAMALAMAGVGSIIFAHGGRLISPDLNRQVLGSEDGLDQPRAPQFAARLQSINRFVTVEAIDREPDDEEATALARRSDVVLSSAPTFAERLRLNRAAVLAGVPLIDAAQWGMSGTLIAVQPGTTACLRCIYPRDPEFEEPFPVVGGISTAIGGLAALEAIKVLAHTGEPLFGRLWLIDAYRGQSSIVALTRDPQCPCCGGLGIGEETGGSA
jgi:molybdopterin/thiamine biosynthesis adenylyltransferase